MSSILCTSRSPIRVGREGVRRRGFLSDLPKRPSPNPAFSYCANLVKQYDYENYLLGLLTPSECRDAYFAIRAFNVEIALIKDQTNANPQASRMRFNWWRGVLEEIYSSDDKESVLRRYEQPVVQALAATCAAHPLSKNWFDRCLDARQQNASNIFPTTMNDLEDYAEHSHSSILYLTLEAAGMAGDENVSYMASHIGVSSGISRLLRGFVFHATKREVYIPQDVLSKHNLSYKTIFAGPPSTDGEKKALKDCIFDVASQGFGHLDRARAIHEKDGSTMPSGHMRTIGVAAAAPSVHFQQLRAADFDPFHPSALEPRSYLTYQIALLKTLLFRRL